MPNETTAVVPILKRPSLGTVSVAKQLFSECTPQIVERLPQHLKPSAGNMIAMALTAIQRTPKLLDCTPLSVLQTMITCSELGLNLNPAFGEVYAVPYKNICTPILGYRGLMKLCEQSTDVRINAANVYEADEFDYVLGTDERITHRPSLDGNPGPWKCAYAVGRYTDGTSKVYVLTPKEAAKVQEEAIRKAGSRSTEWRHGGPNVDGMRLKTAVRRLCKLLSMSPEVMRAIEMDEEAERIDLSSDAAPVDITANPLDALAATFEVTDESMGVPVEDIHPMDQDDPAEPRYDDAPPEGELLFTKPTTRPKQGKYDPQS